MKFPDPDKPIFGSVAKVLTTGAAQVLLPGAPNRVAFVIFAMTGFAGGAISDVPPTSATDGAAAAGAILGRVIKYEDFGELVKNPWYLFAVNAGETVLVLESLQG